MHLFPRPLCPDRISQQEMTLKLLTHNVRAQVDEQDGDGADGHWNAGDDVDEEGAELSNVLGQGVGDGFLQVVKDQAAWGRGNISVRGNFYQSFPEKKFKFN